ncbi:alpha/beta-hydrolase [Ceratobasidium sp. AG-I]|nr:alpha/beta-hydrolase [Ceratobasidium sp. AG-I]
MTKERKIEPALYGTLDGRTMTQVGVKHNRHKVLAGWSLLAGSVLWSAWRTYSFSFRATKATSLHTNKIEWPSCGDGYECGRLLVPLNYQDETRGYANLSIARLLAKSATDKIGSLFVNPGGPGASGVQFLYQAGPALAEITDNRYDIISWDPRGVGGSSPTVDCYESQTAQDIAFSHTNAKIGFEARNLSDPIDRAVYTQQALKADAENAVIAELCLNRTGETLRYFGTASVVRDLELLSRVIEGPEKPVNLWGFSYGAVIGGYFVNMFPHRVGRIVLDSGANPEVWANVGIYKWNNWDIADAGKTYTNFLKACEDAGPARCALNTNNTSTAPEIRKAVEKFINDLYERPLPVPLGKQPYVLTSGLVRKLLFSGMYRPRAWAALAEKLAAGIRGDGAPILDSMLSPIELDATKKATPANAGEAVFCTDGPEFGGLGDVDPRKAIEAIVEQNVIAYERISPEFASIEVNMCHLWKPRAVERFTGPFNRTDLANDILVIGNTADPINPLKGTHSVNKLIRQSHLIIQDGSGHCSIAMASPCTGKALRAYFLDGVLPPHGLVCDTVEQLFPEAGVTIEARTWLHPSSVLSEADVRLAENMRSLGQALEPFVGLR